MDNALKFLSRNTVAIGLLLTALILAACETTPAPSAQGGKSDATPVQAAATATDEAIKKADAQAEAVTKAVAERDSKLKANITTARSENQNNPEGKPKVLVDIELGIADSRLDTIKPDPVELATAAQRKLLVESGKVDEARKSAETAMTQAKQFAAELAEVKSALALAITERDKARASESLALINYSEQMEKNRIEAQKALDSLKSKHAEELDKEKKTFMRNMGYALIAFGGICIVLGAFSVYSKIQTGSIGDAITLGVVWATFAAFLFTCAWAINQWWFKWLVICGGSLTLLGLAAYLFAEYRSTNRAKTRMQEADEAEDALKRIVLVLDKNLPPDSPVFAKLTGVMNDSHKALLHELRAEVKRSKEITA